jgi:hypothetical protein
VSVNIDVLPRQISTLPDIGDGIGFTESNDVVRQPVVSVYVINAAPADTAVATPVTESMAAIADTLLLQCPPDEGSVNAPVKPAHIFAGPEIADGNGSTVIIVLIAQPVPASV